MPVELLTSFHALPLRFSGIKQVGSPGTRPVPPAQGCSVGAVVEVVVVAVVVSVFGVVVVVAVSVFGVVVGVVLVFVPIDIEDSKFFPAFVTELLRVYVAPGCKLSTLTVRMLLPDSHVPEALKVAPGFGADPELTTPVGPVTVQL